MTPKRKQGSRRPSDSARSRPSGESEGRDDLARAFRAVGAPRSAKARVVPPPAGVTPDTEVVGAERFALINWILSVVGVVALIFGYVLLSKANPRGDNLAANVAPFIILGSYLMIFVAIVLRAPTRGRGRGKAR